MNKIVFVVESNCADPAREDEFNEWYNNIHVPDVLEMSGVLRGSRYVRMNPSEGQAKYLAIYEIETDDFQSIVSQLHVEHVQIQIHIGSETTGVLGRFAPYVDLYLEMLNRQLTYDALRIIGFDQELMAALAEEMVFMQTLAHDGKIAQGLFVAQKAS